MRTIAPAVVHRRLGISRSDARSRVNMIAEPGLGWDVPLWHDEIGSLWILEIDNELTLE